MSTAQRHPARADRRLRRGVTRAALAPLNLAAVGLGAAAAVGFGTVAGLAAGGAAYLAMVAWDLSSPAFWKKVVQGGEAPASLPDPGKLSDAEVRRMAQRLGEARAEIDRVMAQTPRELAAHVEGALGGLAELDGRAARLLTRADELARHLGAKDEPALRAEALQYARREQGTADPETRRHYAEARAAREGEVHALAEIGAARERIMASLLRIVTTLEGVPTKVVRMRALDEQTADALSGDVGNELERMNTELGAFEETLQAMASEDRR